MSLSSNQKKFVRNHYIKCFVVLSIQLFILSFFIGLWEFLAKNNLINTFIFSSPSSIIDCFIDLYKNNNLFIHIYTTLYETIIAFICGIGLGFIVAIILYLCPFLYKVIEPFLTMLNSLPKVALGPILIIWFGANTESIIIMALLINGIISIMNILNGFNNTETIKIKMLQSLHANKMQVLKYLIIPNSYRTIISSLKINISMTLIGVIMGEFLVSKAGIGYLIIYGTQVFNLDLVMTGIVLLCIISFVLYKFISTLENILIKS